MLTDCALVAMYPFTFASRVQDAAGIDCSISTGASLLEG